MHTCWTNAKYVDLALKVYAMNPKPQNPKPNPKTLISETSTPLPPKVFTAWGYLNAVALVSLSS